MPLEVPSAPKVRTTVYDNFKGVDFTNDSTNIWHRRSPSGLNMLPDASGRPFKRTGWEILLSNSDLATALSVDVCEIQKCAWFELAGKDHIVIFTDQGVVFYNGDTEVSTYTTLGVTAISTDSDCFTSYDRCFFFEGGGTSAFYIYGNYRMWMYDSSFTLTEITSELTIPKVLAGASALCVGTTLYGFNLLYNMAEVTYNDYDLFNYWASDGVTVYVDKDTYGNNATQVYTYDADADKWKDESNNDANFGTLGITVSGQEDGNKVYVINAHGVMLLNNVDINNQASKVIVKGTTANSSTPFDTPIPLETDPLLLTTGHCLLHTDPIDRAEKRAWIEFYSTDVYQGIDGEDFISVIAPSSEIVETSLVKEDNTHTASLDGEVV